MIGKRCFEVSVWLWIFVILSTFISTPNAQSAIMDSIPIKGISAEGMGIAAWGQGHAVLPSVNGGGGGAAFYNIASRDFVSSTGAAVRGNSRGQIIGFANFISALNSNGLNVDAITIQFGRTTLGEDMQGIDWLVNGSIETRYYYRDNTTDNKAKILINGTPILECNTPKVTVNIDYKGTQTQNDDVITGAVGFCRMTKVAGLTDALSIIADAFLNDAQNRAVRMRFQSIAPAESFNFANTAGMYFEILDGVLELDNDGIRTGISVDFTSAVRNENITAISNMLFDNYLHRGETKQMVVQWFTELFADMSSLRANVNNINYTLIDDSTANVSWMWLLSGKNAQGQTVLLESNTNTNIFKKDGAVWKLYGNQSLYDYWAGSVHFEPNEHYTDPNGYYSANFGIKDNTGAIKSVHLTTANDATILTDNGSTYYLTPNNDNTSWSSVHIPTNLIFGATAPVNLQYNIIVTKKDDSTVKIPVVINGGVTEFATDLSANFVSGALNNFTFTGIPNTAKYTVELFTANGNKIWDSWGSQGTSLTSIPYTGNSLPAGNYYFYVVSNIDTGISYNISVAKKTFSVEGQSGVSFTAIVNDLISNTALQGVFVELVSNPSKNALTDSSGSFTINGLPVNTPFQLKMSKSGYVPTYTSYLMLSSNGQASAPFSLLTQTSYNSMGIVAGKGVIRTAVARADNASAFVGGATIKCISQKYGACPSSYQILYYDGTNWMANPSTYSNGRFMITDIDDGDNISVTAVKDGWVFNFRNYRIFADALHQGRITGLPVGSYTENDTIRSTFTDAYFAYQKRDIDELMSYFSESFLEDGKNKEAIKQQMLQQWANNEPHAYIVSIIPTINNSNQNFASALITTSADQWTEYFIKENGVWKIYGNQQGANNETIVFNGSVSGMQLTQMLPNVTVTMVGNPSVTTTTNQNGQFSLSGLPKNTLFALKIVGSTYANPPLPSFFDTYSAYYMDNLNITALMPFPLYPSAAVGTQGPKSWLKDGQPLYQQGKGIITGKVVDNVSFNGVGGAVVTCTSAKYNPCPYPITYNSSPTLDVNAFGGSATGDNGLYYIYNVDINDNVTVTATKDGWQFRQRVFGTYANAMMVGLIIGGTVATQVDGINNWEQRLSSDNIQLSLAYGNRVFVSGGQSEFRRSTNNGVTWSDPISANDNYNGIRFADGRFLAAGTFGKVVSSVDNGSTWQTIRNAANDYEVFNAVTAIGSTIVAVGHRAQGTYPGIIVTSTDNGFTWTRQEFTQITTLNDVIYAGGKFVAVGRASSQMFSAVAKVAVSTDGLDWQIIDAFEDTVQGFNAIAYGNNMFVAVGYGLVAYSCDGINWSRVQNAVGQEDQLKGIAFGNGRFLAVGGTYPQLSSVAISSSDGINWTKHTMPTNYLLRDVAFGNGYFVVIGDDVQSTSRIYSTDSPVSVVTGTGQCGAPLDYPVISSIELSAGWNFISVPRSHPTSDTIESAFSGLINDIRIIWSYQSGQWKRWKQGNANNTLTNIIPGKGYWIYMNNFATLQLGSWQELRSSTLSLSPGWNLIGWQGQDSTPVATALQGKNWKVAWGWDNGLWSIAVNGLPIQMPPGINVLTHFNQGKAYWIWVQ